MHVRVCMYVCACVFERTHVYKDAHAKEKKPSCVCVCVYVQVRVLAGTGLDV